jgi:hypothetical protein
LNPAKGTAHYEGEVEGEVEHFEIFTEYAGCAGKAGVGGRADNDFKIKKSIFKLFDDGFGRVDFTDAYGVEPDALFLGMLAIDYTKPLVPAGPVAFVPDGPIYNNRAVCCQSQQIYKVN